MGFFYFLKTFLGKIKYFPGRQIILSEHMKSLRVSLLTNMYTHAHTFTQTQSFDLQAALIKTISIHVSAEQPFPLIFTLSFCMRILGSEMIVEIHQKLVPFVSDLRIIHECSRINVCCSRQSKVFRLVEQNVIKINLTVLNLQLYVWDFFY